MARPSNTQERRRQIVRSLEELLPDLGYERASIARIARGAGLAPGLVHYHFKSKEEILLALADDLAGRLEARWEARAVEGSALDSLVAFLEAQTALGTDSSPSAVQAWVAIGAEALRQPAVRDVYRRFVEARYEQLVKLVRASLVEAGKNPRRARNLAALLLSAVDGAFQLSLAAPDVLPGGFAAPTLALAARGLIDSESPRAQRD